MWLHFRDQASWLALALEALFWRVSGQSWGQCRAEAFDARSPGRLDELDLNRSGLLGRWVMVGVVRCRRTAHKGRYCGYTLLDSLVLQLGAAHSVFAVCTTLDASGYHLLKSIQG
jgi:hypothetical protein